MARVLPGLNYLDVFIEADADTLIVLPNPTISGGGPLALGIQYTIVDNMGTAGAHNIAIRAPVKGGATGTSLTSNYQQTQLRWMGSTFSQTTPA